MVMALPKTTLEQWAVLAAVVDQGGFAQAGLALSRSQSAVSYSVARLQEAIGLSLLSVDAAIDGRKAALTPHGRTLLNRARAVLHDLDTLESLARGLKQGWEPELRLIVDVAFPRARLLRIVAELQQTCPSTQIQLSDVVLSGAEEAIARGAGDVVVTSRVPANFLGDYLMHVNFVAVARSGHALFGIDRELTTEHLVPYAQAVVRDSGTLNPRDEGWLGAERRFTVSSMDASLALVVSGLAYAWLPEHLIAAALADGSLRRLPLALGGSRKVELQIFVVRPGAPGPAVRAAVDAFHRNAA